MEPVPVALTLGVTELLAVPAALDVPLGVGDGDEMGLKEGEMLVVAVIVGEPVSEDDALGVAATLAVGDADGASEVLGEGETVAVSETDTVSDGEGDSEAVA